MLALACDRIKLILCNFQLTYIHDLYLNDTYNINVINMDIHIIYLLVYHSRINQYKHKRIFNNHNKYFESISMLFRIIFNINIASNIIICSRNKFRDFKLEHLIVCVNIKFVYNSRFKLLFCCILMRIGVI